MANNQQNKGGPPEFDTRPQEGAALRSNYLDRRQDVVGVPVDDLVDFKSARVEEFLQFVIGEFFAAGSIWLALERYATVPDWREDGVFGVCVAAFIAGIVITAFGYRQLKRTQTRIDRIIAGAKGSGLNNQPTEIAEESTDGPR